MSKLLGDRILIEQDKTEEKTASGVYLAKTEEMDDYKRGVVIEVGPGKKYYSQLSNQMEYENMQVMPGDKVIFQFGNTINVDGKQYLLVQEDDIIRIL